MRTLINIASVQASIGACFIVSLVVLGNIPIVKAEDAPSVEGEWVVTSTNDFDVYAGDRYVVVRQGDGYDIKFKPQKSLPASAYKQVGLYHGTPTQIMAKCTLSYADLAHMYEGTGLSNSALMEWADRISKRYQFTLSEDGRSAEYSNDKPRLLQDPQTGRIVNYTIIPYAYRTNLSRVSKSVSDKEVGAPALASVESRGEFYFLTKDGRKLTGVEANKVPLEEGAKVVTGSTGHVRMTLPDDTIFTVGPNSDLVIDKFVYDPATDSRAITANLSKGVFRWITGKTVPKDLTQMKMILPVGYLGIRGTDFEATVEPNGSGSVVLYFGQLEITEKKTGFKFILEAGQKVTFDSDGSISRPMKAD